MEKSNKRIVIAGCGFSSIDIAVQLKKSLKDSVEVLALNEKEVHTIQGFLPELVGNLVHEKDIQINLKTLFQKHDVQFKVGQISSIKPKQKTLKLDNEIISYDYLVLGFESRPYYFGVKGALEHSIPLKTIGDAKEIQSKIKSRVDKIIHEKGIDKRKTVSVIIIGAGLTGIETACEINSYFHYLLKYSPTEKAYININVIDQVSTILPGFNEKVRTQVNEFLKLKGVKLHLNTKVVSLSDTQVHTDKGTFDADTIIWVAGTTSQEITDISKVSSKNHAAIKVNRYLQAIEDRDVFAVGDNTKFLDPITKNPIIKAAMYSIMEEKTIVKNIIASVKDKPLVAFKPKPVPFVVSVGQGRGVFNYKSHTLKGNIAYLIKKYIFWKYTRRYV